MDLPSEDALRWIVQAYARLRAAHGDAIGMPELVHPTATYLPNEFRGDAPGVARLLRRMMTYAPIADDLHIELAILAEDDGASTAGRADTPPFHLPELQVQNDGDGVYRPDPHATQIVGPGQFVPLG